MNAVELYRAGSLTEAVQAQNEAVKKSPADIEGRSFLGELLCIAGNLDRADAQMETITKMNAQAGPSLGLVRQLIRAEKTRQEVLHEGRVPEFLNEPPEHLQLRMEAAVAHRGGDAAAAQEILQRAEEARPGIGGTCDGAAFDDFRDLDDLCAGAFEVLTSTGRYFWIPTEEVVSVAFDPPSQPLDLLWRPAEMDVRGGPDGKVFLPAIYGTTDGADDASRLGRRTDWVECGGPDALLGVGLRTYLVGEESKTLFELSEISFEERTE